MYFRHELLVTWFVVHRHLVVLHSGCRSLGGHPENNCDVPTRPKLVNFLIKKFSLTARHAAAAGTPFPSILNDWEFCAPAIHCQAVSVYWKSIGLSYIGVSRLGRAPPAHQAWSWRPSASANAAVLSGESNAASSSPSNRGYAEGAPQCGLHRTRERRRRRRVDGAS